MSERYLTMLDVSQKQSYIFSSNKLKDNVINSVVIDRIMKPEYFEKAVASEDIFSTKKNLVYSGGGHSILEFDSREKGVAFTRTVTAKIHREYADIEVYAVTIPYQSRREDGELMTPGENIKRLSDALRKKKNIRRTVFHQGSFGIEHIDSTTLKPIRIDGPAVDKMSEKEEEIDKKYIPGNYRNVSHFESLGGDKGNSNYIAVVHIDGNAMGERIKKMYEKYGDMEWDVYRENLRSYSKGVDEDFKSAYKEMAKCVAKNLDEGRLKELKLKDNAFPVRRIITAGDDVCFVSEGRIGIECAVAFLRVLGKKEQGYAACAGVAIVHQKYPFYRAYEMAELLCKNAKKLGVSLDDRMGKEVSAIDWHIEYGEMGESLEEIRRKYQTADGKRLEMRPYIVSAPKEISEIEPFRQYDNFKKLMAGLLSDKISYAKGKIKEMKMALREGEVRTGYYLKFNKIEDITLESYYDIFKEMDCGKIFTGQETERPVFVETHDKKQRSYLYDAIELMDTYINLEVGKDEDEN